MKGKVELWRKERKYSLVWLRIFELIESLEVAMNGGKWESDGGWKNLPNPTTEQTIAAKDDDMSHMNKMNTSKIYFFMDSVS